jgi:putative phage-type endonuclease
MTTATAERQRWLEDRKGAIGASDAAAILGISPYATSWEVWADKTDRLEAWKGNEATKSGQAFERAVLDCAEAELGQLERNVRLCHADYPLAATLDARVVETGEPVEAKTTGLVGRVSGDWGDALTDQIPDYYLVQCHTQLIVTGAELAYLYALIAGRGVVAFKVERNDRLHSQLIEVLTSWWDMHIVRGVEPERKSPPPLEVVKRLRKSAGKSIAFGQDEVELLNIRNQLKEAERDAKRKIEEIDAQILLRLGDAEEAICCDGTRLTYFERQRKSYTVEASSYRQIQVIKPKVKA